MIKKFISRDCELSASGVDGHGRPLDPWNVTRQLLHSLQPSLRELDLLVWSSQAWDSGNRYAIDCSRQWIENGMCFYSDQSHPEACSGELCSPSEFAASSVAMLQVVERARRYAEVSAEPGAKYSVTAANADTADPAVSWGSHLNVAVSHEMWDGLFVDLQRPALLNYVASVMAAGIAFFGSGLLLPLRSGEVVYSTSARAHQISKITTLSTMEAFGRGLLNSRREAHAHSMDRLHLIGFDYTLIGAALLGSFLQCALAAAEQGYCPTNLMEPVRACRTWSFGLDPSTGKIESTARLVDGRQVTLAGYMRSLVKELLAMVEARFITPDVAPEAECHLPKIVELCDALERGDLSKCARNLDWAAKLMCLLDMCEEPGVAWGDGQQRLADHDFTHVDPERGAIWQLWDAELVDFQVNREQVEQMARAAPAHGRGWARGQLIKRFHHDICDINWGHVEVRRSDQRWSPRVRIELPSPDSLGREEFAPLLQQSHGIDDLVNLLARRRANESAVTAVDPLVALPQYLTTDHDIEERLGRSREVVS